MAAERSRGAGLRERKKQQTRELIAATAARLFADRGYERVTVADVAAAAEVAEQTVYNYFPAKRDLVLDQDEQLRDRLTELIRNRDPGTSPARAIRAAALAFVALIPAVPADQARGGLGYLAAVSPAVRRLCLEMTDRHATAIATAIAASTPGGVPEPALAKIQGIALAWVFQTITEETGRRMLAGQPPEQIAAELGPVIGRILDEEDRWFSAPGRVPPKADPR